MSNLTRPPAGFCFMEPPNHEPHFGAVFIAYARFAI